MQRGGTKVAALFGLLEQNHPFHNANMRTAYGLAYRNLILQNSDIFAEKSSPLF